MIKISKLIINNPKKTILCLALISLFFGVFVPRISFKADMKDMVPMDDPVIKDLQEAVEVFGSQNFLMVALQSDNIFRVDTLEKIDILSQEFSTLKGVEKVTTPLNIDLIEGSEFLIEIAPVVEHVPQTEQEVEEFKEKILASQSGQSLVAKNGKAALILITLEPDLFGNEEADKLTEEVLKITQGREGPEKIYVVGDAYVSNYAKNSMMRDLSFLFPLICLVVMVVLYLSFRSKRGVVLPLLTVFLSVIWMTGFMALVGFPFSIVSVIGPIILVAVGSAYGIHIINKYYEAIESGLREKEAVLDTMRDMNSPVVMTAFTTAAGFMALATSFVIPIRQFGIAAAFGVLAAMILSLSLIPAILVLQEVPRHLKKKKDHRLSLSSIFTKLGGFVAQHAKVVIVLACSILVFFLLGIPRITSDADMTQYLGENNPAIEGMRVVEKEFGGSGRLMVVVDTGEKDGIKEPEALTRMREIGDYLNSLEYVSNSSSLADLIRQINQVLSGGDPAYYTIPETRQAVAQELLLFTMQGGSGIDSMVSYNFEKGLITAQLESVSSKESEAIVNKIDSHLENNFNSEGFKTKLVGTPKVMMRLMEKILDSQMWSLALSIVIVVVIVSLLFASITTGLLCALPLVFTVGINFGLMGYSGISLDVATAMIASIAIGIGIDYSIHFISRYNKEVKRGKNRAEALTITTSTTGRGIFFNAVTLMLGFAVLLLSSFYAITIFGYLISLTMLISSLAALTLIPAVLRVTRIGSKGMSKKSTD